MPKSTKVFQTKEGFFYPKGCLGYPRWKKCNFFRNCYSIPQQAKKHGISSSTAYRWLKDWNKDKPFEKKGRKRVIGSYVLGLILWFKLMVCLFDYININ